MGTEYRVFIIDEHDFGNDNHKLEAIKSLEKIGRLEANIYGMLIFNIFKNYPLNHEINKILYEYADIVFYQLYEDIWSIKEVPKLYKFIPK